MHDMSMHGKAVRSLTARRYWRGAGALLLGGLALVAAGCGSSSSGSGDASASGGCTNVSFGLFGPLTGTSAIYGQTGLQAAKLAVTDFEKTHAKCHVSIVQYDSQGDPAPAPGLARSAVENSKVLAIDGPSFTGESQAADPIFNAAGMPLVTASATATTLSQQGWKVFHRTVVNDGQEGPAEGRYLVQTLGYKRIAVIDNGQAYGKGLGDDVRAEVKKLGATIVDSESIDATGSDYTSTVGRITAAKPQVVYCGCLDPEAARLLKQLRAKGNNTPFSGGAGLDVAEFIPEAGKAAATGTIVGSGGSDPTQSAAGGAFMAKWKAAYGGNPGLYAVEYYNAATAILNGIGAGKTSRQALNTYISSEKFEGPTGPVAFDAHGNIVSAKVNFYVIKNGQFVYRTTLTSS